MRRLALSASLLVVLVAGVTSCGDKTDGQAVPGNTGTSSEGEPTTPPTTSGRKTTTSEPNSGGNPLADVDPCSLLTSAGQTQLGIANGEKRTVGAALTCRWQQRESGRLTVFSLGVLDELGIKDVPPSARTLPNIGDHQAAQGSELGGPGTCTVVLGVSESSRVDSTVTAGTDTQKACDLAMQMSRLVEPELP